MKVDVKELINKLIHKDDYSLTEKRVGKFVDGKPIYRKCKVYTYSGSGTNYDIDFFTGTNFDKIISQRIQILSNATYAKAFDYWSSSDFCRCWIYLPGPYIAFNIGGASNGTQVLLVVEYTKTTD